MLLPGPPPRFPDPHLADADGLVAYGGQLAPEWLLAAYRQGIFPWPCEMGNGVELAWFSPDPRPVIPIDNFHVPRRLARRLRRGEFTVTFNQRFEDVIRCCAAPRDGEWEGTWITEHMVQAYCCLHHAGHAHSAEAWCGSQLVGGVYGVAVGGAFSGESMFYRRRDASKAALSVLLRQLASCGFQMFDVQQMSPHVAQMGAIEMPRPKFLAQWRRAVEAPVSFSSQLTAGSTPGGEACPGN